MGLNYSPSTFWNRRFDVFPNVVRLVSITGLIGSPAFMQVIRCNRFSTLVVLFLKAWVDSSRYASCLVRWIGWILFVQTLLILSPLPNKFFSLSGQLRPSYMVSSYSQILPLEFLESEYFAITPPYYHVRTTV